MRQIFEFTRPLRAAATALGLGLGLVATVAVSPATAQGQFDNIVTFEVLDGGWTDRGTYQAALHLQLAQGWKTYWRAPGEAGIPPRFNWQGSKNVADVALTWPTPEVFSTAGLRTIGYHDALILPIEITPHKAGGTVRLAGKMDLGLCREVCIPSEIKIEHTLDPDAGRNPLIAAALAQRPFSAREGQVTAATCHLSPSDYGMSVEAEIAMPSAGGVEVAIIESGNPNSFATETTTHRDGNRLHASSEVLPLTDAPLSIDRSALRITVLGQNYAVDIKGCTAG